MTEQQAIILGFVKSKVYTHDQYMTNRYTKGLMSIEFTYENGELESTDLTIEEVNCIPISFEDLNQLDKILNLKK